MRRPARLVLAVLPVFAATACSGGGGGGGSGAPPARVAGSYQGTWTSTASPASGAISVDLVQSAASVSGSGSMTSPCTASIAFAGTVRGSTVSGSIQSQGTTIAVSGTVAPAGAHLEIVGSYGVTAGPCAGDVGMLQLLSTVPAPQDGPAARVAPAVLVQIDTDGSSRETPAWLESHEAPPSGTS